MKKVLLVTGGSRGIGAATSRLAAKADFAVCVNYHSNATAADKLVEEIRSAGGEAIAARANVGVESEVTRMFEVVDNELGPLCGLVNNAGILEHKSRLDQMALDRWKRVFDVNVFGAFLCAREAVRRMATSHGGHGGAIVNVSSAAARLGGSFEFIDYGASKGALDTMTIGLANEVASEGVRVNGIRPGLIDTEIHANSGSPDRVEKLMHRVPIQRGGSPEEVAEAIIWLLSDKASYVTGVNLDVTGGR